MSEPKEDSKVCVVITRGALAAAHDDDGDTDHGWCLRLRGQTASVGASQHTEPHLMHAVSAASSGLGHWQEFTENIDWANLWSHTRPPLRNNKPIIITIFYAKYFTVYLETEYLMSHSQFWLVEGFFTIVMGLCYVPYFNFLLLWGYKSSYNLLPP